MEAALCDRLGKTESDNINRMITATIEIYCKWELEMCTLIILTSDYIKRLSQYEIFFTHRDD